MNYRLGWFSAIFAGVALATVGYTVRRALTKSASVGAPHTGAAEVSGRALQAMAAAPLGHHPTPLILDLSDLFDARDFEESAELSAELDLESTTVRAAERVPQAISGDDLEAVAPEDVGASWLAQATQTGYSATEPEWVDIENLAAPDDRDFADEDDALDEEPEYARGFGA